MSKALILYNEEAITSGMIIRNKKDDLTYRIITITDEYVSLCQMETTYTNVFPVSVERMQEDFEDGELEILNDNANIIYDLDDLTEHGKQMHKKNIMFINDLISCFDSDFLDLFIIEKRDVVKSLQKKYNMAPSTFWRYVRKYLQSGMNVYSLLDKRCFCCKAKDYIPTKKPGRPSSINAGIIVTPEVKKHFDYGIDIFLKKRNSSFHKAYRRMLDRYYSYKIDGSTIPYPESECPTYKQFYYYAQSQLKGQTIVQVKKGKKEFANNNRILSGDSKEGIEGPGYLFEMDENEFDVYLVSDFDRTRLIGRPVLYIMLDVYSNAITAMSVGFENNSIMGFKNCFINLGEDKTSFCKKYGIPLENPDYWPSNVYPMNMRFDRGAEYRSDEVKRFMNAINVNYHFAPPAMGSLKGCVEQFFHQIQNACTEVLENHGLIQKTYDSNHQKTACLTLDEFTSIVIKYILMYNQKVNKEYPMSKDMVGEDIQPSPMNIWKYGCSYYGSPRPISNPIQYAYELMTPVKNAKLSRRGIKIDDLYYHSPSDPDLRDEMYKLGNRNIKFKCRMDERDVSKIYYTRRNVLMTAVLNPLKVKSKDYIGKSRNEYLEIRKKEKELKKTAEHHNTVIETSFEAEARAIVNEAAKLKKGKSDKKDIRANRKTAKFNDSKNHTIADRYLEKEDIMDTEVEKQEEAKVDNAEHTKEKPTFSFAKFYY